MLDGWSEWCVKVCDTDTRGCDCVPSHIIFTLLLSNHDRYLSLNLTQSLYFPINYLGGRSEGVYVGPF